MLLNKLINNSFKITHTMKQQQKLQHGQGMTEYIIILSLVAVAAITVFGAFGGVNRAQVAAVANEIAGNHQGAKDSIQLAQNYARYASDSASYSRNMGNYNSSPDWSNYSGGGSSGSGSSGSGSSGLGDSGLGDSGTGSSGSGSSGTGGSGTGGSGTGGSGTGGSGTGGSGAGGSGTETLGISDETPNPPASSSPISVTPISPTTLTGPALVNTGLGESIEKLISKSPTLIKDVNDLLNRGYTIVYGDTAQFLVKVITLIDSEKTNFSMTVQSLAHEIGHALHKGESLVSPRGLTRKQFIDKNVFTLLTSEGAATLYNLEITEEILANTNKKIDIGIAGANISRYKKIFEKYKKSEPGFTKTATEAAMGRIYGNYEIPNGKTVNYFRSYQDHFLKEWDRLTK